jgi:NDP-sugar pyrophosphorylase family protein
MNPFLPYELFDLAEFEHKSLFEGCTYAWEALFRLKEYLASCTLGNILCPIPEGVHIENRELVSIGKGTTIEYGAFIRGPCVIGENCEIRHSAYIRGDVIAGNGCVIGHTSELKHTILLNKAHAAHFAYVGDSILGNRVNLGAGTKCANLKLDGGAVKIRCEGKNIDTGMRKLGAILGDGVQVGCNAVLNPGTIFGKNTFCYPVINVGGYFPAESRIKTNKL